LAETRCPHGFLRSVAPCPQCTPSALCSDKRRRQQMLEGQKRRRAKTKGFGPGVHRIGEGTETDTSVYHAGSRERGRARG
jgi:hypothetical protein